MYIKVIVSNFHTNVYNERRDFGFPLINFPWLSGDIPRLPSYCIYISQWFICARCVQAFSIFLSKNLQITSKLLTQGHRYHRLSKTLGSYEDNTLNFCPFGEMNHSPYHSHGELVLN